MRGWRERKEREMARKRRRSIGDTVLLLVILAALVWAFAPGVAAAAQWAGAVLSAG